jgi:hypothetical protein
MIWATSILWSGAERLIHRRRKVPEKVSGPRYTAERMKQVDR